MTPRTPGCPAPPATVARLSRHTNRCGYSLVFRPKGGRPYVRCDNAHRPARSGGRFAKRPAAYDHWHRAETGPGRPYTFTTAMQLLDDFWREMKRVMNERGIANDL